MGSDIDDILAHFDRTAEQFFSKEEFAQKLATGRKLRIKYGVDVTAPTLHLGHAVNLWLMRYMQNLGHKVVFLIGDFTTRIGDPDGRLEARPVIARDEIDKNAEQFIEQAKMVLRFDNPDLLEIRRNSEWLDKMSLQDFLDLAKQVTHAKLISRDMFQKRIAAKKDIYMHEMLYPVLQGWDSVAIRSDLTIIGSDQLFNEMMGRFFQEKQGDAPQTIITTKITPGIDGKAKQSKSLGNYIGLGHSARDKYGRVMRIPDELIEEYFKIYTDIPLAEIESMSDDIARHPKRMKDKLAYAIVGRYHGHEAAIEEQKWFEETFTNRNAPNDMPVLVVLEPHMPALQLVCLAYPKKSKSDARRLLTQGAVELNGEKISSPDAPVALKTNDTLHIGKRDWWRIEVADLNALETEHLWMKPLQTQDIDTVRKNLPQWEMVKYLGKLPASQKEQDSVARDVLKRIIAKPDPKDEWLWKISHKKSPDELIGVAHLRRDSAQGNENVWLREDVKSKQLAVEAMEVLNEHAFTNLGFDSLTFREAFRHSAAQQEIDALMQRFSAADFAIRNRDDPTGFMGVTKDGWQLMKQRMSAIMSEDATLVTETSTAIRTQREHAQKIKSGFTGAREDDDGPDDDIDDDFDQVAAKPAPKNQPTPQPLKPETPEPQKPEPPRPRPGKKA